MTPRKRGAPAPQEERRVLTPDELRAKFGEQYGQLVVPGYGKFPLTAHCYGNAYGDLFWKSQAGMQSELFFWSQFPWKLHPEAHSPGISEFLLGGSRGPGKTDALIAWMAEPIANPRYRGLMLRFESEALKETIDRASQIYGLLGGKVHGRPAEFHFESGAIVYTGHLRDDRSFEGYKGHEYHRIGLEEGTQISRRELYLKLLGSNRSTVPGLYAKSVITSNPDGPGNNWLKQRFVNVTSDGRRVPPKTPLFDSVERKLRMFIPGRMTDNAILLKHDAGYYDRMRSLEQTNPALYKAWVEGDWDAVESAAFPEFRANGPQNPSEPDWANHVIDDAYLPPWCHRWISCDWGYGHHSAVYWFCNGPDGRVHCYRELVVRGVGSDQLGAMIAERSMADLEGLEDHHMTLYLSHEAFGQRDAVKTIAEQIQTGIEKKLGRGGAFLAATSDAEREADRENPEGALDRLLRKKSELGNRVAISIRRCNPDRTAGANYIRNLLRWRPLLTVGQPDLELARRLFDSPNGHVKAQQYLDLYREQKPEILPMIQIHRQACNVIIDLFPSLVADKDNIEQVMKFDGDSESVGDDPYDGFRFGCMAHRDHENRKPFGVRMQEEIEKHLPAGCTDMNIRYQVMLYAQQKLLKEQAEDSGLTFSRECMRGRQN